MTSALQFNNVTFSYETDRNNFSSPIIEQLSFTINQGEFISFLGPSGSGKSTIFRLITGLEHQNEGEILLNDKPTNKRLGIVGYMPQKDMLMPWRTILENAALPLELKGVAKQKAKERVLKHLKDFGLQGVENHYPSQLSGGMRQRVSFLRSILSGKDLLLLDEPFSALDAMTRMSMQEWLLKQWAQWQKTIIFITHDVEEAIFLSDRIYLFTEKPIRHYKEYNVPLERPRTINDLHTSESIELKKMLLDELRHQVRL